MSFMDAFLADAESVLAVARAAADETPADIAVVLGSDGSICIAGASGWNTAAILAASGAAAVYRINRGRGRVRVEGLSHARACILEPRAGLPTLLSQSGVAESLAACSRWQRVMHGLPDVGTSPRSLE
jgi:hypothetical protein